MQSQNQLISAQKRFRISQETLKTINPKNEGTREMCFKIVRGVDVNGVPYCFSMLRAHTARPCL